MCACNALEERKYLINLRKELSGLKGQIFFEKLANAKQIIWISGETADKYNELIRHYRFKAGSDEQRQEFNRVLAQLILG